MSFGKKKVEQKQEQITAQQVALGERMTALAEKDIARRDELSESLIKRERALASGDRELATSVMAPILRQTSEQYQLARNSILNMPPGPAKEFALADLERKKFGATALALSEPFINAPTNLANIGAGFASTGTSLFAGGLRGFEGAAVTNKTVLDSKAASKASTLGLFGQIAQAAGGGFGGSLFKSGGGGGVSTSAFNWGG